MSDGQDPASPISTNTSLSPRGSVGRGPPRPERKKGRTLTAAQLERKRANDREAQRAIRERTRSQIETLEARIKELESGDAHQKLQAALNERDAAVAENVEIKSRLNEALDILRPILAAGELQKLAESARTVKSEGGPQMATPVDRSATASTGPYTSSINGMGVRSEVSSPKRDPPRWTAANSTMAPPNGHLQQHSAPTTPFLQRDFSYSQDAYIPRTSPDNPMYAIPESSVGGRQPYRPQTHLRLPNNVAPTCAYDAIFADFRTEIRQRQSSGVLIEELLGPPYVDFTPLVFPDREENGNTHRMSHLFIKVTKAFEAIEGWPVKIAIVTNMFYFMRWIVHPTPESFGQMPEYMRPTESQVTIPHPIWFDFVPWPAMRHALCCNHLSLTLDEYTRPFTRSLAFDYPRGTSPDACLYHDEGTGALLIRPELKDRWLDLNSWSVGREFARAFPSLLRGCVVRDD